MGYQEVSAMKSNAIHPSCCEPTSRPRASGRQRKAFSVDPGAKTRNLNRLKRIEGQVRGVQRMVQDERYCIDILTQITAIEQALRAVSSELLNNHIKHCIRHAVASSPASGEESVRELVDWFMKRAN
jgi:DNA-binding FrmR family transcriptional regulator